MLAVAADGYGFRQTHQEHTWQAPRYRFNRGQQRAFHRLIMVAEQHIDCSTRSDSSNDSDSNDSDDSSDGEGSGGIPQAKREKPGSILLAVLEFCIELLNQSMQSRETEIALVCALAVLGVRPQGQGFPNPDVFPSILSSIIKIAYFVVVLQAEQLAGEVTFIIVVFSNSRTATTAKAALVFLIGSCDRLQLSDRTER